VFHDNNRDGMQVTQAVTRAFHETFFNFHPQVTHDLHESLPLLYIMTATALQPRHRSGDHQRVDQLWLSRSRRPRRPGLARRLDLGLLGRLVARVSQLVTNTHHSIGRFYETYGNGSAGTYDRDLSKSVSRAGR